ncbi:MAG: DUF2087 domain-containing protein [Clostridia bacterium]|nr:DUF2087 domain-containing protein [Clostridia bacterium]
MDYERILRHYMDDYGRLTAYPAKRKLKVICLMYIATKVDDTVTYTEKQFDSLLNAWHTFGDWCLLRREMCDYKMMWRTPSGSEYHKSPTQPTMQSLGFE